MNVTGTGLDAPGRHKDDVPGAFRAVVLYENRAAGEFARRALDLIAGQLDLPPQEVFIALWRLDVARQSDLEPRVADDLAQADLIIIAASQPAAAAEACAKIRRRTPTNRLDQPNILLLDPQERLLREATIDSLPAIGSGSWKGIGEASWIFRTCA